ncbi:FeoB-associated Cys-rich membrane protein [uncultured Arcticibacterium sp.]|uniref:FeoB-associated Cys-rich membrane protein n=1 Tax=uncultured Arcticibacterium sp. TaxID=2173042 RepID=UPI0030FBBEBB
MVIIENLVIIALAGLALGYLIKMIYKQFSSEGTGCSGCASGGCSSMNSTPLDFPEIVNRQK